ncbi:VWA domain-containing protein [Ancylobacter sp.]|uniref:VWA domain-containing protein n=1 Tax=Ancylobacter sp. TaxID=1872567 RepID=UPI003D119D9C
MAADKTTPTKSTSGSPSALSADTSAFLAELERRAPLSAERRGRLIFGLDATMSRQPTWDLACGLQMEMFEEAARVGGLDVQLVYYRGLGECRASPWMADGGKLGALMARIQVQGGRTQIGRVLNHAGAQAAKGHVGALVFVGDAMEENVDALCAEAGPLALRGVPAFMFQEGGDIATERAFREIARLTKGAYCRFDAGASAELRALLRAAASYAAGGSKALAALAGASPGARRLISAMQDTR